MLISPEFLSAPICVNIISQGFNNSQSLPVWLFMGVTMPTDHRPTTVLYIVLKNIRIKYFFYNECAGRAKRRHFCVCVLLDIH